ncbi:MAG: hypothetical protein IJP00_05270 [Firmicutes bacterium]|nr:hypothetical protein [Bacillota bacterium]
MSNIYIDPILLKDAENGSKHSIVAIIDLYNIHIDGAKGNEKSVLNAKLQEWKDKMSSTSAVPAYTSKYACFNNRFVYRSFAFADIGYIAPLEEIKQATGVDYESLSQMERLIFKKDIYIQCARRYLDGNAAYLLYKFLWNDLRNNDAFDSEQMAAEAIYWLTESAKLGYIAAARRMASLHRAGVAGLLEQSDSEAEEYEVQIDKQVEFYAGLASEIGDECYFAAQKGDSLCRGQIAKLFGKPYDYISSEELFCIRYAQLLVRAKAGDFKAQEDIDMLMTTVSPIEQTFWKETIEKYVKAAEPPKKKGFFGNIFGK